MKPLIPEAALKKHIAILGMNGSGKTSVAKSQVIEPALDAGERVCNIDPTGVGWGLRLSKTGKSKGFEIYIVGGEHADFPLVARDGKAWGEIVGTTSDSFVFDTSMMTVEGRSQWFTDFAETLLRKNKGPLNFVLDEAHLFAPQGGSKSGGVAPKMLHATNNLLALGRSKGLRITMISQRPAKLHKDSLTQAHTLIAMQLMSPQDREAIKAWVSDQADAERGKEIIASLPNLDPGEGWIWAPKEKVLDRVRFALPKTFDSSSAPDEADGEGPQLTPINPDAIKAKLETVARETVANDPAKLRAEIARLTALTKAQQNIPQNIPDASIIAASEQRGFDRGFDEALARGVRAMGDLWSHILKPISTAKSAFERIEQIHEQLFNLVEGRSEGAPDLQGVPHESWANITGKWPDIRKRLGRRGDDLHLPSGSLPTPIKAATTPKPARAPTPPSRAPSPAASGDGILSGPQRKIIEAIHFWQTVGTEWPTREQVAAVAGYSARSGSFRNTISQLNVAGYISGDQPGCLALNGTARSLSLDGIDARSRLNSILSGPESKIIDALLDGSELSRQEVANAAVYSVDSGSFRNTLSSLHVKDVIRYPSKGTVALTDWARQVLG